MKSLTGQYECAHRSGLGLDYFTARVDHLILYANGRFALTSQEKSRIMHAAKSLASGQQASMDAPETKREGRYSDQGDQLFLNFDDGEQTQAQIQEAGIQFGSDYFEKVSDSTFLPPPQRVKNNMEDIAKGLKIAGTIGGTVLKAARTIQSGLQNSQPTQNQSDASNPQNSAPAQPAQAWQNQSAPAQPAQAWQNQAAPAQPAQAWQGQAAPAPTPQNQASAPHDDATLFCDQCGSPVRPGKSFCNKCGARLP